MNKTLIEYNEKAHLIDLDRKSAIANKITRCFEATETLLKRKLSNEEAQALVVGELSIKELVRELFIQPDGDFDWNIMGLGIVKEYAAAETLIKGAQQSYDPKVFQIKGSKAVLTKEYVKVSKEKYCKYAETERATNVLYFFNDLKKFIEEHQDQLELISSNHESALSEYLDLLRIGYVDNDGMKLHTHLVSKM